MYELVERLFPLPRSITGDGVRETLAIVGERIPLEVTEVPIGTPVLDWTVPREWNIAGAWIAEPGGRRMLDVVGYSVPNRKRLPLSELREHVATFSGSVTEIAIRPMEKP